MAKISVDQALLKAKAHAQKGEIEDAKKLYQTILQAFPKNKRAQQGLAVLNKPKQAATSQTLPQEVINHLINLYNHGQLSQVVEQAQSLTQQYPEAFFIWNILGAGSKGLGQLQTASEAFKKVTELNPKYAQGFNNLGVTLQDQGKLEEAIASYDKALSLKPDYASAYYNVGNVLKDQGKVEEAIASYEKALSLKPDYAVARSQKMYQQAHICDWSLLATDRSLIEELGTIGRAVTPFSLLSLEDAPERHRLRSVNYAEEKFPFDRGFDFEKSEQLPKRLKVGYFSADFHNHATMYLMAQIFERHDKKQFEIYIPLTPKPEDFGLR